VPDYVIRGGSTYRVLTDQLGSPRMAVNVANSSDVPFRADYSSFGVQTMVSGAADWMPFGFAAGMGDADTGLVRFGARDYDSSVGRWLNKDPIRFHGDGANMYVYVDNEPVNGVDPTGLLSIVVTVPIGPVIGIGAGAGALACALSPSCRQAVNDLIDDLFDICRIGDGDPTGDFDDAPGRNDATPAPPPVPPSPDDCVKKCLHALEPNGSYLGRDGHIYRNDLGGMHAFQVCVAECRGLR
jgi:RHS repeat-associated protein